MQNCLDLHFASASDYQCQTCETKPNLKKIFKINTVLAIDTENMFLDHKIKDTEIPNEVTISSKKYNFVAFISRTGESKELGHYIAYIKLNNSKWEKRNDLENYAVILNTLPTNMKIELIIYIEKDNAQSYTSQTKTTIPINNQDIEAKGNILYLNIFL